MLGLLVGTLCLFGLFFLLAGRRRRHRRFGGCAGKHRRHGHHHRGRRGWRRHDEEHDERDAYSAPDPDGYGPMNVVFGAETAQHLGRRLGLAEDQQGMVEAALADSRRALSSLWTTLSDSRSEIANALRGEKVDDERLAAVFEWHDEALAQARREVTTAWKAALLGLTPAQRAKVADFVAGPGQGWV